MLSMENWRADFDERYPIYEQITNRFCRSLVKGDIRLGDRIPSIRDMALSLKVNANTIQRAYQEMERRNLIYSQRGMGYFVKEDESLVDTMKNDMVRDSTARFLEEMHALGFADDQIIHELKKQLKGAGEADGSYDDTRS